ncbi:PAS domain-containing protein, partial [Streptococcus suis]
GESINDLSDVFRMAHDNLEQEKNRLASILTYMTDGVLATDRSGKIVMINETAQQQFNLAYDEALSMNIVDMLGSGSPYSFQDLVSKT